MEEQLLFDFDTNPLELLTVEEIFDTADEAALAALSEDRRIERKQCNFSGESLGEYFSMWANTSPQGGLIALGQNNDGTFSGCSRLTPDAINKREKTAHVYCPDARESVRRVAVTNTQGQPDFVLLFRVKYHPNLVVRTSNGRVFVRKGDSKVELKPDEIAELQAEKGEVSFELRETGLAWPGDFDQAAVARFVSAVRTPRRLPESMPIEQVLEIRRLGSFVDGAFVPNLACALLFAHDPIRVIPGCKIRFQRFEGETEGTGEKYNPVKNIILEGSVPSLIQQIETVLESQLRTFSPLDAKLRFFPQPEYPKPAWYEAVVNACVHRTYGNGMKTMPIFVKMFDDRLVIESPGLFPAFVTPENIYESHNPRNPHLMDALFYLDYVQCAHEGTRRIRDTLASVSLPAPDFRQDDTTGPAVVRVTLRNNVKQRRAWVDRDVAKIVSESIVADLSENEKRVINLAVERGHVTVSDANKYLGMSWKAARVLLLDLTRKRVLQYIRFRKLEKDIRDPKAFFRVRSAAPIPPGAFEQVDVGGE